MSAENLQPTPDELMNEFHEAVSSGVNSIGDRVNLSRAPEGYDNKKLNREVDGKRQMLDASTMNDSTFIQYNEAKIDEIGRTVNQSEIAAGPIHSLGNGKSSITGETTSRAQVTEKQGRYSAIASTDGYESTGVSRLGYGKVEIKNPKAKVLVAKLAQKALAKNLDGMDRRFGPPTSRKRKAS